MDTDTIRRDNPRHQGDIGVGAAIAYFMANAYRVAVPLGESQPWDLIVERKDGDDGPERVQVKTTTRKTPYGIYEVQICTNGGNRSATGVVRPFDPAQVEWLFVLTDDLDRYLVPTDVITSTRTLNLGHQMAPYLVGREQLQLPL
ncbi:MAG: hypothetical protein KY469_22185 [Actinobacteria bacterium]|nr:hypothetical protein [Actinomycetota bacterium]